MARDIDDPESVTQLVYHPLQAPSLIPKDKEGWAIQVGHEGVRLTIKNEDGPLSSWGINLRDHYSYLVLLNNPNVFIDSPEIRDWTDVHRRAVRGAGKGKRQLWTYPGIGIQGSD